MANTLAYGFVGKEHLLAQRVTVVGEEAVYDMIDVSVSEYSRMLEGMLDGFVMKTIKHKFRHYISEGGTLQPIDEYGDPLPSRPESYFDVSLPIRGGGTAFGTSRVTRALQTVLEAARHTQNAIIKDANWMRRHMLAAVFDNANWTFGDSEFGALTIKPLANGDTDTYPKTGGDTAVDTHQLAQAAAIDDDNNPFPTIRTELNEHPGNGDDIRVYVPTNLVSSIEDLTDFVEAKDDALTYGSATTQIAASGLDAVRGFGDDVKGRCNKCWIIEWKALPDSYMLAHAAAQAVLGMREYPSPSLQGLFLETDTPGKSLHRTSVIRYCGFGVINRVAAVVYRIGNAAYAIPTGYDTPIAV